MDLWGNKNPSACSVGIQEVDLESDPSKEEEADGKITWFSRAGGVSEFLAF